MPRFLAASTRSGSKAEYFDFSGSQTNEAAPSAKKDKTTGEIWVKDKSRHGGDHYEVYKNKGAYEKGDRDRQVWADGSPGKKY